MSGAKSGTWIIRNRMRPERNGSKMKHVLTFFLLFLHSINNLIFIFFIITESNLGLILSTISLPLIFFCLPSLYSNTQKAQKQTVKAVYLDFEEP